VNLGLDHRSGSEGFRFGPRFRTELWQPYPCGVRGMTRLLLICSPIFLLSLRMAHALLLQPHSLQNGTVHHNDHVCRCARRPPRGRRAHVRGAPSARTTSLRLRMPMYSRAWCCTSRGPQARAWAREIAVEARGLIGMHEEGYWLDVPADGSRAVFGARSMLGLFRGSNPIAQLWLDGEGGVVVYTLSAPVAINVSPVYVSFPVSWRCVGC
jgi:hypothetical protein